MKSFGRRRKRGATGTFKWLLHKLPPLGLRLSLVVLIAAAAVHQHRAAPRASPEAVLIRALLATRPPLQAAVTSNMRQHQQQLLLLLRRRAAATLTINSGRPPARSPQQAEHLPLRSHSRAQQLTAALQETGRWLTTCRVATSPTAASKASLQLQRTPTTPPTHREQFLRDQLQEQALLSMQQAAQQPAPGTPAT